MNQLNPYAFCILVSLSILMAGAISLGPAYVVAVGVLIMVNLILGFVL